MGKIAEIQTQKAFAYLAFVVIQIAILGCNNLSVSVTQEKKDMTPVLALSHITISSPNYADGASAALVTLTLMNASGQPVEGLTMSLSVSGAGNTIVPCTASDMNGFSRCKIYSTISGLKTISANGVIVLTADSMFLPNTNTSFGGIVSSAAYASTPGVVQVISSSGISETPTVLLDAANTLRAQTSVLGAILSNW